MPTTGISLIRPHTERIRPPRALWVPFQLGHPLGAPDNPAFQRKVLEAVLKLLEAPGPPPVLEDFPEDEPESDEIAVLACPVNFYREDAGGGEDSLLAAFQREMTAMRPWYEISLNQRQRTTVGASRIDLDDLPAFIYAFANRQEPANPRDDVPLIYTLKFAVEDLKSYYIEGITAQPGQATASNRVLQDWFWDETVAGKVLLMVKKACESSPDKMVAFMGGHFIVPGEVARRQSRR